MKLERLHVERFRRFSELTVEFAPGLNIIRGRNEAGKTTLHRALHTVLFERPRSTAQELRQLQSWDHEQRYLLALTFSVDGRRYRLTKDFEARSALLEALDGDEQWRDQARIEAQLETWLGPAPVYQALAWLAHTDLVALTGADKPSAAAKRTEALLQRLQQQIAGSGSPRPPETVIDLARRRLAELRKGLDRPAANPGPLRSLLDQLDRARAELATLQQADRARRQAEATHAQVAQELAELTSKRDIVADLLTANRTLREQEAVLDKLEQQYAELQQRVLAARTLEQQWEAQQATAAAGDPAAPLPDPGTLDELAELELRLARAEAALEAHRQAHEQAEAQARTAQQERHAALTRRARLATLAALAGGVVALGALGLSFLAPQPWTSLAALLAAAGVLGLLAGLWQRHRARHASAAAGDADAAAVQAARQALQAAHHAVDTLAQQRQALLDRYRARDLAELNARVAAADKAQQQRALLEQRRRDLLGDETLIDLEARLDTLHRELKQQREAVAAVETYRFSPEALLQHERDLAALETRIASLQQQQQAAAIDLARQAVDPDAIIELEARIDALQQRYDRLARQAAALELVIDTMTAARDELLAGSEQQLGELAGPLFAALTGGRYQDVRLDERLQGVAVRRGERWIDASELSRGSQDQLYFALRLALLRLCYPGLKPPLLLDDPFITFDDARAAACMRLLQTEIAPSQQVLLFTYSDRYGRGDHRIELPAPDA